jgi:hypothetical protein
MDTVLGEQKTASGGRRICGYFTLFVQGILKVLFSRTWTLYYGNRKPQAGGGGYGLGNYRLGGDEGQVVSNRSCPIIGMRTRGGGA